MKKIILSYLFIIFSMNITRAQEFTPSEQAKGFSQSNNTSVDHATGIFQYQIPLFELSSGNFKLPISLTYSANGVKVDAPYNGMSEGWSLIHGGCITRTKRSSLEDENNGLDDIYSATFNGHTLHFIYNNNQVIPLEKTHVKIQYNQINDYWTVTDETGTIYTFDVRETTKNGYYNNSSNHFKNVKDLEYTSAWYVSRIQVFNSDPIEFDYSIAYNGKNSEYIDSVSEVFTTRNYYYYGTPMIERTFDFGKYKKEYTRYLSLAEDAAKADQRLKEMEYNMQWLEKMTETYKPTPVALVVQNKIMGILSDLHHVAQASQQLFDILNQIIEYYGNNSEVGYHLYNAKLVLNKVLKDTIHVSQRIQYSSQIYTTMPVFLKSIKNKDCILIFNYDVASSGFPRHNSLKEIQMINKFNNICQVKFSKENNLLKQISWHDKKNTLVKKTNFSYYNEQQVNSQGRPNGQADLWGYSSTRRENNDSVHVYLPDSNSVKTGTLQKIINSTGTEIMVDYELNRYGGINNEDEFGGIRVKSIIMKNNEGHVDSIRYFYPRSAQFIHAYSENKLSITYPHSNITDKVFYTRVRYYGETFIKPGNNGIYYDYVIEKHTGKGYITYLFCVPQPFGHKDVAFPYWLCGLPLAKALYNESGNLVQLQKFKYYTDLSRCKTNVETNDYFSQGLNIFNYTRLRFQTYLSEFHFDKSKIFDYYKNLETIVLYRDNQLGKLEYSPLYYYYKNIDPRTNATAGEQWGNLVYGGKTLLKEQITYEYPVNNFTFPNKSHLTGSIPDGAFELQREEYLYDTLNYIPVGVLHSLSNGDEKIDLSRTALNFESEPTMTGMIAHNLIHQPVKEISLLKKNGSSKYLLIREKVTSFIDSLSPDGRKCFMPRSVHVYKGSNYYYPQSILNSDASLFNLDLSYREEISFKYVLQGNKYLVSEQKTIDNTSYFAYEKEQANIILKVENEQQANFASIDANQWALQSESGVYLYDMIAERIKHYNLLKRYNSILKEMYLIPTQYPVIKEYLQSKDYKILYLYVSGLVEHRSFEEIKILSQYVRDTALVSLANTCNTQAIMENQFFQSLGGSKAFINSCINLTTLEEIEYIYIPDIVSGNISRVDSIQSIHVNVDNKYERFKAVVIINPIKSVLSLDYTLTGSNGSRTINTGNINVTPGKWQLVTFDINANSNNTSMINLSIPLTGEGISLALLVPEKTIYKATSFFSDGNVSCNFNQNGEIKLYEYDNSQRVSKIYDKDGNIIQIKEYNILNN